MRSAHSSGEKQRKSCFLASTGQINRPGAVDGKATGPVGLQQG